MEPTDERTLDVARRTRKNLEYMDAQCSRGEPVYEFTQLFNSMLGLVISIREEYYKGGCVEWSELEAAGLLHSRSTLKQKEPKSFSQLVSHVRHAFAHSNYNFVVDTKKKIIGVELWNLPNDAKDLPQNRTWVASFSEQELRELSYLAVNYLEFHFGMGINGNPSQLPDCK